MFLKINIFTDGNFSLQFGNIRAPNGEVFPIDWTDFNLNAIDENLLQAKIIQIEARGFEFICEVKFSTLEIIKFGNDNSIIVPINISCNGFEGFGVAIFKDLSKAKYHEIQTQDENYFPTEISSDTQMVS